MSLKQLAAELGLSLTTVSRALNGYPEVAESTRQSVRAAAARLNYRPDARARGLAIGRAGAVGLVLRCTPGDLADACMPGLADALSEQLARAGIDLLMIAADERDELAAYRRAVAARRVDAFVVARTRVDDPRLALLHGAGVAFVACGRSAGFSGEYAWFDVDHAAGAHLATSRLLGFGHRAFGYIGAPPCWDVATQRYQGFAAALAEAGVAADPGRTVRVAADRRSGYRAMQALLARPAPPTAVLVDNRLAGVGALHALFDAGKLPGRDVSVIVCDGLGPDSVVRQRVTAVEQPGGRTIGRALAAMMLARLSGVAPPALQHLAEPVLVAGDSDGPVCAAVPRAA